MITLATLQDDCEGGEFFVQNSFDESTDIAPPRLPSIKALHSSLPFLFAVTTRSGIFDAMPPSSFVLRSRCAWVGWSSQEKGVNIEMKKWHWISYRVFGACRRKCQHLP
eukprot:scaffold766_cov179-Amphora_coffeaeformis.AAC.14